MKLPELKEKLKSKYIVRVVAGVLTIALVGTGIGATAVFAEKNSTAVTAEADSTTDSSKDADDIADKLMDSVSLKDNDADKDESVYLISDANGNVNKTIVVDHLKNKDKKDTLEDASNLSDIENVKGKEKFTQSGDKLTWQAGGKDIYYQGTATEEPPVTQKVTYYLDGKEISPEDLAGKSGKVKIRFDYTNTTSYTETVNGEKQTVSVPFAAVTGLVLGDGFENIEVTNGKAEVSDSSSVVLGYALPGLKDSLGIKDKDLDGDVNIPEYMEMTADVKNFSMPAAMTFVVNASDYVSTDGIDTSDLDDMINDLKDASTQLQDGSKTLAEGTDTLADGLSTLQSKLGTFASGVGTLQSGLKTYTDGANSLAKGASDLDAGIGTLAEKSGTLVDGAKQLNDGAKSLKAGITSVDAGVDSVQENVNKLNGAAAQISTGASDLDTKAQALAQGASDLNDGVDKLASTVQGMPETVKSSINGTLKQLSSFVPVLIGAGYDNTLAQTGVTVDNVDKVTTFAKEKEAEIKEIIARSATKNAYGYNELNDKSEVDKTYNEAMEGLYKGQGAVMVYTQINQTVSSEQSQNQVKELTKGASSLKENIAKFQKEGTTTLKEVTSALATGTSALASGLKPLKKGTKQLVAGSNSLAAGTDSLVNSIPTLTGGIKQLKDGSSQLNVGAAKLTANNAQLNSGASQLADGTNQIVSGVDQLTTGSKTLSEGAHTLADGMVQFNEEGINKILDAYNGDLKPFTDKLQAVIDAGEEYQTYSAIADGQTGSVKFIYKLASIDAKADSDK
jgi:putative membrane protein